MYTNFYVFRYAAIMVIIVAALLSTAAMLLKPAQERNIMVAKMQGILASANVEADAETAEDFYNQYIVQELAISADGEIQSVFENGNFSKGDVRAFEINLKKEQYKKSVNEDFVVPLYIANIDGETVYIIPLLGKGLWGPVWGNIAVGSDMNTAVGAIFDHKGETPGLGAEITENSFSDQFIGKKIFDDNGKFTSILVVKGGIQTLPQNMQIHGVDAISGGTITSNAVSDMIKEDLENYIEFFQNKDI